MMNLEKKKYIFIYYRYYCKYEEELYFRNDEDALKYIDDLEDYGLCYATYLIKPNGDKIDLKKDYEERFGLREEGE